MDCRDHRPGCRRHQLSGNQGVEATLISYNQAATDLESIRIWWHAVELAGKTKENFDKLVRNTEGVLQSEHAGWEQEMRNALVELDQEELVIEETE